MTRKDKMICWHLIFFIEVLKSICVCGVQKEEVDGISVGFMGCEEWWHEDRSLISIMLEQMIDGKEISGVIVLSALNVMNE